MPEVRTCAAGTVTCGESQAAREPYANARDFNQQANARIEFVPARPGFEFTAPAETNFIDTLVFAQLKRLQINPSQVSDDATFLRRVYLDVTGRLPTVQQSHEFLDSTDANKRSTLIDRLLASPEFVDFQALR